MTESWADLLQQYSGRHPSPLAFGFEWWHYNFPLIKRINQVMPPPARILQVGTGTGALAVFFAAHRYEVVGIDIDPRVVERAKDFAEHFRVSCRFEVADAFDLSDYEGKFDLAFSAGVIEHFSDCDATRMLQQKGRAATYVVATVPTWHALRNDPLSEASGARSIRLKELKDLFKEARLEVLKSFGYGTPDGKFSTFYKYVLPHWAQWLLQNHLSYACTIGCIGRSW